VTRSCASPSGTGSRSPTTGASSRKRRRDAQIAEIDEASRRIRFTPALPADILPAVLPDSAEAEARNLRVRRWDQAGEIVRTGPNGTVVVVQDLDAPRSTGVIVIPAAGTTLLLENGVTVSFSSVGAKGFRRGDAWVFAARTADASVEPLAQAAPRYPTTTAPGLLDIGAGTSRLPRQVAAGGRRGLLCCRVSVESHANGSFTIRRPLREAGAAQCASASASHSTGRSGDEAQRRCASGARNRRWSSRQERRSTSAARSRSPVGRRSSACRQFGDRRLTASVSR
jgi:hypothetical protein